MEHTTGGDTDILLVGGDADVHFWLLAGKEAHGMLEYQNFLVNF
jgi:hypothetical protein